MPLSTAVSHDSPSERLISSPIPEKRSHSLFVWLGLLLLCAIAVFFFAWPIYRAFLTIGIDDNEGWNAYFAEAAMGKMPLYPAADQLITNNYPPISFFVVGWMGRLLGDVVLAGRLISLASTAAISGAVGLIVLRLGGNRLGAVAAGAFFLGTMSFYCMSYVGMNDPQLLANAVMSFAFAGFLYAMQRERGWLGPVLLMVVAGFIKHNIITMPLTAFIWLLAHRPRQAVKTFLIAIGAIVLGFAVCYTIFGPDFFLNQLSPRDYVLGRLPMGLKRLMCLDVSLVAFIVIAYMRWRYASIRLCSILVGVALAVYLLQKPGGGVDVNAGFDLIIALSVGVGLTFTHAPRLQGRYGAEALRVVLLLALCCWLLSEKKFIRQCAVRLWADPSFMVEIAAREKALADNVALVRATPGDVQCLTFVRYRAGKPFVIDSFNTAQRIDKGLLPKDTLKRRRANGTLTKVKLNPLGEWE